MEQVEFNNIQDTKFSNYFSDIENLRKEDLTNINLLIKKYPYCQALHLLAARSAIGTPSYEKTLAHTAVSVPSRNVLYNFIHHPEKFKVEKLKKSKIEKEIETETLISIIDDSASSLGSLNSGSAIDNEKYVYDDEVYDEIISTSAPDNEPLISIHHQSVFEISQIENLSLDGEKYSETLIADENVEEPKEQAGSPEEEIKEEISLEDLAVGEIPEEVFSEQIPEEITESEEVETLDQEEESEAPAQEEEIEEAVSPKDLVIEEIQENILTEETSESIQEKVESLNEKEELNDNIEDVNVKGQENLEEKRSITIDNASLPYIENIEDDEEDQESEDDFIPVKDQKIESRDEKEAVFSNPAHLPQAQEPVNLTRYDDERLPYTFLWWLAKTRKTYQENIRPYATFSLDTTQEIKKTESDFLEHQIAENIFHINSINEIENKIKGTSSTVAFDFMKKEHQIIEKFIKEEPQIKPPPANKIDTENKAKLSSEDSNELVSETLAKVYVEQMLFHKALDVYKKLSLKYPEKSAYFASQIKYLELKVN